MTPPPFSDALGVGTLAGGVGALLGGTAAWVRAKTKPGDPTQRQVKRMVRQIATLEIAHEKCEKDRRRDRDELSAVRTEVAALRKLIPGGEWFDRLGYQSARDIVEEDGGSG